jgi:hypothetical protein
MRLPARLAACMALGVRRSLPYSWSHHPDGRIAFLLCRSRPVVHPSRGLRTEEACSAMRETRSIPEVVRESWSTAYRARQSCSWYARPGPLLITWRVAA